MRFSPPRVRVGRQFGHGKVDPLRLARPCIRQARADQRQGVGLLRRDLPNKCGRACESAVAIDSTRAAAEQPAVLPAAGPQGHGDHPDQQEHAGDQGGGAAVLDQSHQPLDRPRPPGQDRHPLAKPPQVVRQRRGGRVAPRRLGQALETDRLQIARRAGLQLRRTDRLGVAITCTACRSAVAPRNGGRPVEQLVQDRPQRVDVRRRADLRAPRPRPARGPCSSGVPRTDPSRGQRLSAA